MNDNLTDYREIEETLAWLSDYWKRPAHPEYLSPRTVDEAVSILNEYGAGAVIMAGGIDVVGLMKNRIISPEALVNIKNITGLDNIKEIDGGVRIGAMVKIVDLAKSALIKEKYPLLAEAAATVASPQIRNMATVGGNLCQQVRCWYYRLSPVTGNSYDCLRKKDGGTCYAVGGENQYHAVTGAKGCFAVCPSDLAVALQALDASVGTVDGSGGRSIKLDEFYTPLGNALKPDEIIKEIKIPRLPEESRQGYHKFRLRKAIDFAIVSAAAVISFSHGRASDSRIVIGGVAHAPYRAVEAEDIIRDKPLTEELVEKASAATLTGAVPLSKNGYKVAIARTLIKRALMEQANT